MAGSIRNDEDTPGSGKIPVGHIDRDSLLAFGWEAINKQREVEIIPTGPVTPRVSYQGGTLIIRYKVRVVEKEANQCRFSIVDRAAGDKMQKILLYQLAPRRLDRIHLEIAFALLF